MNSVPVRRGPRGGISRTDILAAADRVLVAGGLAALSVRAVAREAGVTANAVYTYVTSMAELRNGLADAFLATLDLSLLQDDDPQRGLRCFLEHVLEVFRASPSHVEILAQQRVVGEGSLDLQEALLTFFEIRCDRTPARAAEATMFLTEWVHGHTLLSSSNIPLPAWAELSTSDLERFPRTAATLNRPTHGSALDLPLAAIFVDRCKAD